MTVQTTDPEHVLPERVLTAYADATRIVASPQLVARFQERVADERAARRTRIRALFPTLPWSAGLPIGRHVGFALRLQSLTLVLLAVMALGAVGGGAGAVLLSVAQRPGPAADAPPPDGPRPVAPPTPASPAPSPVSTPTPPAASPTAHRATPTPTLTVTAMAQRRPKVRGNRGSRATHRDRHEPAVVLPACVVAPVRSAAIPGCPF